MLISATIAAPPGPGRELTAWDAFSARHPGPAHVLATLNARWKHLLENDLFVDMSRMLTITGELQTIDLCNRVLASDIVLRDHLDHLFSSI